MQDLLWKEAIKCAMEELVEGYARVKKVRNNAKYIHILSDRYLFDFFLIYLPLLTYPAVFERRESVDGLRSQNVAERIGEDSFYSVCCNINLIQSNLFLEYLLCSSLLGYWFSFLFLFFLSFFRMFTVRSLIPTMLNITSRPSIFQRWTWFLGVENIR